MKAIMKNMARQENPNTGGNVYENFASFLAPGDNSNALRELLVLTAIQPDAMKRGRHLALRAPAARG